MLRLVSNGKNRQGESPMIERDTEITVMRIEKNAQATKNRNIIVR
ncbi:hypothetical protein THTE_4330 [Thermogutta terrifontis]|uniref:Uncharacterized protein n=1 Tax=Thermogutta terrifontis TaxID=1331910 RepID=A0A286RLV6_9BACT|nr:hypothetical protein THTE_4330 [Thermogutta terrifontis]